MNKNRSSSYILPLIICAILLAQSSAYAQDAESEAAVEFVAGTGPTYPVNPDDPGSPGTGEGVSGSLAIVSVSHFDFGKIEVASKSLGIYTSTLTPNIQVVDLRGTAAGWKVSASVSRFRDNDGSTLPGAAIRIITGHPNSISASAAPEQISDTLLTTDGASIPVIKAEAGAGTGHWVMRWYPTGIEEDSYIKLEVPAGSATTGKHTATINWVLGNTP